MSQQATLLSSASCDSGIQPDFCPTSGSEVMPAISGLLPPGPAWEAGRTPGTVMYAYWLAYADILAWFYAQLCLYLLEFHCNTVSTSIDQWAKEYDLYNDCDSFGQNLCAKETCEGGQTCEYFVAQALLSGWVITCTPTTAGRPIAGCFQAGCTMQGPTPVLAGFIIPDGIDCVDYYGVIRHPNPAFWRADLSSGDANFCPVPGSGIGLGPGTLPGMSCFIAGYYELNDAEQTAEPPPGGINCLTDNEVIYFGCNTQVFQPQSRGFTDSTGFFQGGFGDIYTWKVTVDLAASFALQHAVIPTGPLNMGGRFMAGCTMQCSPPAFGIECILQQIAPAHTTLVIDYIQPT